MRELFTSSAVVGAGLLAGAITLWTAGEFAAKVYNFVASKIVAAWADAKLHRIQRVDREYLVKED